MVKGIDVYQRFQGTIDWAAVAKAGVADVFVKLTNGAGPAAVRGDTYVTGAHGAGLKVGGYNYALGGPAAAQADAFAAELVRLDALDLAPALDFEDVSLPTGKTARRTWIGLFFTVLKVRLPGLSKVLLYSSGSELTAIGADTITVPGLTVWPWDAEYGPNDGQEHPVVHYTGRRAIHQYTSVGHVPGITVPVDLDDITADITEEPMATLDATDLANVGHAAAAYSNPNDPNDVDMHQHAVDATAALAQAKANAAAITALKTAVSKLTATVAAIQDTVTTMAGAVMEIDQAVQVTAAGPVPGTYPVTGGQIVVGPNQA